MKFVLLSLFMTSLLGYGQSCVCFRTDYLNDYKQSAFIAHVKIQEVRPSSTMQNEELITFEVKELFRGVRTNQITLYQERGSGVNNKSCRLFLKKGDELILYAHEENDIIYTTPCLRNTVLRLDDIISKKDNLLEIEKLRELIVFQEIIDNSTIRCTSLVNDGETRLKIEDLEVSQSNKKFGLYRIRFDFGDKINRIEVVSTFETEMDKKVRIELIKKQWKPCFFNDKRELLVGYFYYPATTYAPARLSSL